MSGEGGTTLVSALQWEEQPEKGRCSAFLLLHLTPRPSKIKAALNQREKAGRIQPSRVLRSSEFFYFWLSYYLWKVVLNASSLLVETHLLPLLVKLREGLREI